jgi:hypothetical protein
MTSMFCVKHDMILGSNFHLEPQRKGKKLHSNTWERTPNGQIKRTVIQEFLFAWGGFLQNFHKIHYFLCQQGYDTYKKSLSWTVRAHFLVVDEFLL